MSKEFLKQRDNRIRWELDFLGRMRLFFSFEVYSMLTVKERHQIERDSRAPFIYEALKREGLVDESTNTRKMSLKEIYAYIKTNDVKIGGKDCPIIFVSRSDVEYTFKKFEIKGRKAGRKIKSVKADTNTDDDLHVASTSDTTPVDTDNCTSSESNHSEKSVSTVQVSESKSEEESEQMSPIEQQANDLIFKYMDSNYDFWHCCYWPTRRGSIEHRRIAENLLKRDGIYSPELYKAMIELFQYITRSDVPAVPPKQNIAA